MTQSFLYKLSNGFHILLFSTEQGVEPLLVVDRPPDNFPRRLFFVRYVMGEGGENKRPIFKNELTGYDYEMKLTYPTQRDGLEGLQSIMESSMYGSTDSVLSRAVAQNMSSEAEKIVKVIVSEALVARLVGLYNFAW